MDCWLLHKLAKETGFGPTYHLLNVSASWIHTGPQ